MNITALPQWRIWKSSNQVSTKHMSLIDQNTVNTNFRVTNKFSEYMNSKHRVCEKGSILCDKNREKYLKLEYPQYST